MKKRDFLKTSFLLSLTAATAPFFQACSTPAGGRSTGTTAGGTAGPALPPPKTLRSKAFELPPLPYPPGALEPHIDKMTMEIHHGKHHAAYVNNLNDAVRDTVYSEYELEDILARVKGNDAERKLRNNAGGHWNHTFFWQILNPSTSGPTGNLLAAINRDFGSVDQFKEQFGNAAKGVFGSGWAWLNVGRDRKLFISSTPNQDNPLMLQIVEKTGTPILGLDVWEHAYYLKFQNRRPDYITAFFSVVNWPEVVKRFDKAMSM
jgi:Fe-Mn family superoxide dismutase